jgi:signal transduction histidine kinase
MREHVDLHITNGDVPRDCAEQVADAARAAAVAERRRLARDLHDSVTQTLISLHLSAQAAADLWDTQPLQARAAIDLVRSLATGAATEMRELLLDLHDGVLAQQGLVGALEAQCAVVRRQSGLHVELHIGAAGSAAREGPQLPAAYQEALYFIGREALANVVKHAHATHATVTLAWDSAVRLVVEDDGVGYDTHVAAFTYGLAGMRERVEALGGRLQLENRPTGGARVAAEIPLPDVQTSDAGFGRRLALRAHPGGITGDA